MAIDTATNTMAILTADMTAFGLSGVPSWFTGGILSEAGDIGSLSDEIASLDTGTNTSADNEAVFHAAGTVSGVVQGVPDIGGDAMGTIYVLAGSLSADIAVNGNFGGIIVTAGPVWVQLNAFGSIDTMIAPNYTETGGNAASDRPEADIEATNDEEIVTPNNPHAQGDAAVEVSAGVLAIVDQAAGVDTLIAEVILIGMDGVGTTATITGDVTELRVVDNWVGAVAVNGIDQADDVEGRVQTIRAENGIAASAGLTAYNYEELFGDATAVTDSGTLTRDNQIDTLTALNGLTQTLYLKGSRAIQADWTAVFNKVTQVVLTGKGSADLLSVIGTPDARALRRIASSGEPANSSDGAHLGDVTVNGQRLKLDDFIVQGELDSVVTPNAINDMFVQGNVVGEVHGEKINAAFIGGNAGDIVAAQVKRFTVMGTTDLLRVASRISSSQFLGAVTTVDVDDARISSNSTINGSYAEDQGIQA